MLAHSELNVIEIKHSPAFNALGCFSFIELGFRTINTSSLSVSDLSRAPQCERFQS